ncbi:hypothetical protein SAMN05216516_101584 [Izhakiella capsodis]|uniref:Uncharacterized protein n=1 Tax=Izhakiella capsodis TaxID=1367852 RepID=A0A1I4V6U1_9GAMM|nr:hypothetical protein SAMN05216516_101584 [Izhakiella capsodis]
MNWVKTSVARVKRDLQNQLQRDNFLQRGYLEIIPCSVPLEDKAEGIQHGMLNKLRLGNYPLDDSLNLLRQLVENYRQSLWRFICQA